MLRYLTTEGYAAGDPVAFRVGRGALGRDTYTISKVKRVTPTGILVTECDRRFNKSGYQKGADSWSSIHLCTVEEAQAGLAQQKLDRNAARRCNNVTDLIQTTRKGGCFNITPEIRAQLLSFIEGLVPNAEDKS